MTLLYGRYNMYTNQELSSRYGPHLCRHYSIIEVEDTDMLLINLALAS